ncbi:YfhO family protein [Phocaeicola paurosaccharolyticus]|uniref:YfhO family protein n=1 Tax=Phocaeicola paurosaccharolyticus TaxID=732242 RepID=UPI000468DFE8|nr:YfhO family protein [Phocaeicola paurosaccharolyticus]
MNLLKKILPDVVAILLFALISFVYFYPAVPEGRILSQHDSVAGIGSGEEAKEYLQRTGERTRWTNSIFGGMPTYQMSPSYKSTDTLKSVENLYHLYLPQYVWYVFVMLLGFYILLRAFDFSVWLSSLGAIIWAFSSYFFIIIAAGHIWKFITLAYIPPTIAGMVLAYKGKYIRGALLTAIFVAFQIMSNHVQMSYYFLFVMLFMVIAYGVSAYQKKELPKFFKATAIIAIAGILGVCVNLSNLYHTYEYSKETMRGKSELVKPNNDNQTKGGLERDYITQWSYGIGETFSLLVPNVKGGASVPLSANEKAMEKADPMYGGIYSQIGQYWGEQPGTSGPVYVGAFVMFLFVLGMFIVKGPMKWALVAATLLSILLSWGRNFMGFTDLFLDYIPLYDKFRAVSSILVIAEFTIPLLAMLALKEVLYKPEIIREKKREFIASFVLTGGIALLFAVAPRLFFSSFVSTMEMAAFQDGIPQDQLVAFLTNLEDIRVSILTSDAWRSFFIVLVGVAILFFYSRKKINGKLTVIALVTLSLIDMWSVNKRYLYDDQFVDKSKQEITFNPTETDKYILQDRTLDYRVLNMASSTFNENNTSYWHKSIGGYHAAKLRRYQEMIEYHISPEINALFKEVSDASGDITKVDPTKFSVINMLNTRYFIFPLQGGKTVPLKNPYTFGNAWFVKDVKYVENANQEIESIKGVDLQKSAIVDKKFAEAIKPVDVDPMSTIKLISYEPNKLEYDVDSKTGGAVVFSEIYYPGWKSFIDGKEVAHGRANYILRAMNVPSGKHTITFTFDPDSIHVTETIAFLAIALIVIMCFAYISYIIFRRVKKK